MSASEMTTKAKREYVERSWELVLDLEYEVIITIDGHPQRFTGYAGRWDAAFAFTKERERKISEVEGEIKLAKMLLDVDWVRCEWLAEAERILAREQAALQEMRRGMRKEGE